MSQSILRRSGMTSPAGRVAFSKPSRPRSILKRPAALPLSPGHASFSVMSSIKSPHVQFVNTPALLSTYSSDNYDRAPIKVSPNPLALPERGARYYSPTIEHFKLSAPPKPKAAALKRLNSILKASECASPAITDFEDPRSPKAPAGPVHQQIRFASFAAPAREPRPLKQSISSYPRSPYPSAPLSPSSPITEERARRNSDTTIPPLRSLRLTNQPVLPSPLKSSSFQSPSLHRSHKPAPLDLNPSSASDLSNAFWDVMSLEEGETPMVTALEYPESASIVMEEIDLKPPAPVSLMFGTQDGSIWSSTPASAVVPKKKHAARETLLRSALMSPAKAAFAKPAAAAAAAVKPVKRSFIASPSPNDPFASFPSFAAVLSLEGSSMDCGLAFPPKAAAAV